MLLDNIYWVFFLSYFGGASNAIIDCNNFLLSTGNILGGAMQPVLDKLVTIRGIDKVLFITERNEVFQSREVEKLGVLANLNALVARATVWSSSYSVLL